MPPPDTVPTSAVYENRLYVTRALRPESLVLLLAASPPLRSPRRYRGGAAHGAAGRLCSRTIRTARSRTSGENLLGLPMTPSSQGMEPPGIPARFMAIAGDPVGTGLVASLARPGGNITGLTLMAPELVGQQLEILREVVPKVSRVALLGNPANAGNAPQVRHAQDAARASGVRLQTLEARGPSEIDSAFAAMTSERAGAVIVLVDAMLIEHRTRIADLAATRRLPAVYGLTDHAEAGGLIAYGASVLDRFRRTATFVDKILKGAKPGDLLIEQPTKFELVINLKTAKALGLTIPPSLLQRADQVIE